MWHWAYREWFTVLLLLDLEEGAVRPSPRIHTLQANKKHDAAKSTTKERISTASLPPASTKEEISTSPKRQSTTVSSDEGTWV